MVVPAEAETGLIVGLTQTGKRCRQLLPFPLVLAAVSLGNGWAEQRLDAEDSGDVDRLGGVLEQVEADMGGGNRQAVRLDHPGQARRIAKQAGVRLDLRITQRRQLLEDGLERREIAGAVKL